MIAGAKVHALGGAPRPSGWQKTAAAPAGENLDPDSRGD
jgi:hypothetical protein